ncbi:MAG: hypothetical protein HRU13_13940, partial [Phycisphaerales bacterium]|nr:hypothetical protein [Phycisphaerales bacterium]
MRCPACQYLLWNLRARVCPECGRSFELDEWDFENSDALFACGQCGGRLIGTTPESVPEACPSCGEVPSRRSLVIERGTTGRDAPRFDDGQKRHAIRRWVAASLMAAGVIGVVAISLFLAGYVGRHIMRELSWALLCLMAMALGYLVWPGHSRRKLAIVAGLIALSIGAVTVSVVLHEQAQRRHWVAMRQSRSVRGVAQAMAISMQAPGSLPATPQGLVDRDYLPPELFSPKSLQYSSPVRSQSLSNGWI